MLERAYADWYRPATGRFVWPGDQILRYTRGKLAGRLDRIAPPGPILDVGAGDGALLDSFRRHGRAALGLERASTRPDVREAELDEIEGSFAGIVFWHSLEHLREPGAALARAAELLAPGGVLVVAVPNAASLQARAFGDHWLALDLPRHLVHIPAHSLVDRMSSLGLHVQRVSHLRGGQVVFGWLHGLVGLLPGRPNLYNAIRQPAAREQQLSSASWLTAHVVARLLLPVAAGLAVIEAAVRRGGSVYVEARKP
jgi:SAM-dependent methyltransferase